MADAPEGPGAPADRAPASSREALQQDLRAAQATHSEGWYFSVAGVAALLAEVERLTSEIERLTSGPYGIRACRGHFHIVSGDHDIINEWGDALDEATARKGAAELNARHKLTVEDAARSALSGRPPQPTEEQDG